MEIRLLRNNSEIYILELNGSLDLYNSIRLRDIAIKIAEREITGIIIDMKAVENIESAGIGALICISSTLKKINCSFAITNVVGVVRRTIEITKLTGYLPITQTLSEAVETINASVS